MEIISPEMTPQEESKLNPLLKGKNEHVPTTPKILQLPGTPFPTIWVKRNKDCEERLKDLPTLHLQR